MLLILKLKNIYFLKRKAYCIKQYNKYLSLLKMYETFSFSNKEGIENNISYYSALCQKYKDKCLMFSEKIKPILF